jgi:hypothetical protein
MCLKTCFPISNEKISIWKPPNLLVVVVCAVLAVTLGRRLSGGRLIIISECLLQQRAVRLRADLRTKNVEKYFGKNPIDFEKTLKTFFFLRETEFS